MSGKKYFRQVDVKFFHLTALAAVPFRKTVLFKPLLGLFDTIDNFILCIPGLRRMAWVAVIVYSQPKKQSI